MDLINEFQFQEVRCRNNGSCTYGGNFYDNWSRIPTNITGCEKECFCEFGNVTCSDVCPPVPPKPPAKLNCGDAQPTLAHLPDDTCCLHWTCAQKETTTTTTAKPGTFFSIINLGIVFYQAYIVVVELAI